MLITSVVTLYLFFSEWFQKSTVCQSRVAPEGSARPVVPVLDFLLGLGTPSVLGESPAGSGPASHELAVVLWRVGEGTPYKEVRVQ